MEPPQALGLSQCTLREILGVRGKPNGVWMQRIARNLNGDGGFLAGKKHLIHERDPLHTDKFDGIPKAVGVEPARLPPCSPNANLQYHHQERIHQGIDRIIAFPREGHQGEIICSKHLGGLLKSCHRKAA